MTNRIKQEAELASANIPSYPTKHNARELKLAETLLKNKNIDEDFDAPLCWSATDKDGKTLLPAEATAGDELVFRTGKNNMELHQAVVESTGTAVYVLPYVSADGLECPLDADVTDGMTAGEITAGILSSSKSAFTVGTDEDFYVEATIKVDDITDLDQMILGFRKAEAYQAEPDNYDELAAIHVGETGATVADGQINLMTILNGGDTSYTDTTETDWADGGEHTLRIIVRKSGAVEFLYDGAAPTVTASFTFDAAEVVVPFFFYENTSGSTTGDPGISISSLKVGRL